MKVRVHTYMVVAGSDEVLGVAVIADATVAAWVWCTFVDIIGTIFSTIPACTLTGIAVVSVDTTDGAPSAARIRGTLVHILRTRRSSEASSTEALIVVDEVHTTRTVAARIG